MNLELGLSDHRALVKDILIDTDGEVKERRGNTK